MQAVKPHLFTPKERVRFSTFVKLSFDFKPLYMEQQTIRTLASTPPPAHRLWRFKSARSAHAETNRLENLLGLPASRMSFNLTEANSQIRELESMLAAKSAAPVVVAPVVAPVVERFGRERFAASCAADFAAKSQSRPELHGRDRFLADVRVTGTPRQIVTAAPGEEKQLKGRDRFLAAVAKDFKK
jgi:hypothetical protein